MTFAAGRGWPAYTIITDVWSLDTVQRRVETLSRQLSASQCGLLPQVGQVMIRVRNQGGDAVIGFSSLVVSEAGPTRTVVLYGTAVVVEPIDPQ